MKILIAILFIGLVGLVVLSGCISSNQNDKNTAEDEQLTKISNDLNKNATLDQKDNELSNALNEFDVNDTSLVDADDAAEINALDSELTQIDSLLQDTDPFTDLN